MENVTLTMKRGPKGRVGGLGWRKRGVGVLRDEEKSKSLC